MSVAFILATLVVVATPGTGALYTITAGLSRGTRASMVAAAGCTLGTMPHILAAITGLAAVLNASAAAFATLKYVGVAYLLFLAWQTWRDRTPLQAEDDAAPRSSRQVVRTAVLINVLNPKLTIFFFAFLPQFVPAGTTHTLPRMLGLSSVFMVSTFVVFSLYGVFAAAMRRHVISRPQTAQAMRRIFGGTYVALAGRLALSRRRDAARVLPWADFVVRGWGGSDCDRHHNEPVRARRPSMRGGVDEHCRHRVRAHRGRPFRRHRGRGWIGRCRDRCPAHRGPVGARRAGRGRGSAAGP